MVGPGQRFYDDEEAEQILRVAASMSSSDGQLSYERLLDTASELGISPEAVEKAEKQVMAQRENQALQREFERYQKQIFFSHLVTFLLVNAGLVTINLLTSRHFFWFFWPFFGWGIGLVSHARCVFIRSSDSYREEFEKWKATRALKQERNGPIVRDSGYSPSVTVGIHIRPRNRD